MQPIHTPNAPAVVGPYSQAIVHDGLIFGSGQIGIDPATGKLVEGIEGQTRQVMANLRAVLEAAGSSLEQVLKSTIFLTDIRHYQIVNQLYAEALRDHKPARSTIQVAALPLGAMIEIEVIASSGVVLD